MQVSETGLLHKWISNWFKIVCVNRVYDTEFLVLKAHFHGKLIGASCV